MLAGQSREHHSPTGPDNGGPDTPLIRAGVLRTVPAPLPIFVNEDLATGATDCRPHLRGAGSCDLPPAGCAPITASSRQKAAHPCADRIARAVRARFAAAPGG